MAPASPSFFQAWCQTLPVRWRSLVRPYGGGLAIFLVGYGGATGLLQPWALGEWWSIGVSLAMGFSVCWGLWKPWGVLATNAKGETRRVPLLLLWLLLTFTGWHVRHYLRYRLGEVLDLTSVRRLAQPTKAVFFRLRGPFWADNAQLGCYTTVHVAKLKGGRQRYTGVCAYACPLLPPAADTATAQLAPQNRLTPPAWLAYFFQQDLGDNLTPGERDWRFANFVAKTAARFDSADLTHFTYLVRLEGPDYDLHRAVRASRLAPYWGSPLLLEAVQTPFAQRGTRTGRHLLLWLVVGSALLIGLLLVMPLRPTALAKG